MKYSNQFGQGMMVVGAIAIVVTFVLAFSGETGLARGHWLGIGAGTLFLVAGVFARIAGVLLIVIGIASAIYGLYSLITGWREESEQYGKRKTDTSKIMIGIGLLFGGPCIILLGTRMRKTKEQEDADTESMRQTLENRAAQSSGDGGGPAAPEQSGKRCGSCSKEVGFFAMGAYLCKQCDKWICKKCAVRSPAGNFCPRCRMRLHY